LFDEKPPGILAGMVRVQNVDVSDQRVDVGNGVSVPATWTVVIEGESGVPGAIQVHVAYDPTLGRTVADEVRVLRAGNGDEVTSLTLREVRVQYALQVSGLEVSTVSEYGHPPAAGAEYLRRMQERTDRDLTASVVDASTTYRLAVAINLPPLKAVADCLGVSQSTATRLMNRARMEGLAPGVDLPDPSATGPIVGASAPGGPIIGR
jgi:hypothetical protein